MYRKKGNSLLYTDRHTVKVIIVKDEFVLLLDIGLLPHGGVETDESKEMPFARKLREEALTVLLNAIDLAIKGMLDTHVTQGELFSTMTTLKLLRRYKISLII